MGRIRKLWAMLVNPYNESDACKKGRKSAMHENAVNPYQRGTQDFDDWHKGRDEEIDELVWLHTHPN